MNNLQIENKESAHFMWGDIAKGIAIILVIMGHTFHPAGGICKAIFLFHMPLFFFLCGYFFNFDKYEYNLFELLKNTYNRILIPAIFTFLLFYNVLSTDDVISLLYGIGKPIPEWEINPIGFAMWFLFCLVCVRIILWAFLKLTYYYKLKIWCNLIIGMIIAYIGAKIGQIIKLPWSFDIALVAFYIAYCGYLYKKYNLFSNLKFVKFYILAALILGYIDYKYFGLSMNERYYSSWPLVSINISILLSIALVYISIFIEKTTKLLNKFLAYLGINSLIIMVFHIIPSSSHGHIICSIWRLLTCIVIIEVFALIPRLKDIYHAESIKDIFINR